MIYFFTFIIILYSCILVDIQKNRKLENIAIFTITSILILLSGLRYRVGGDTLHYSDTYSELPDFFHLANANIIEDGYAPLWYLLCAIAKLFGNSFVFLQLIHAIIINISFIFYFKKESSYACSCLLMFFLLYYVYYNMEILRESLSVCIFIFNIRNMLCKKYVKYYVLCVFAIGFHYSALILLFFPLLLNLFNGKRGVLLLGIVLFSIVALFFYVIPVYYDLLMGFFPVLALKLRSYATLSINNVFGIVYNLIPFFVFGILFLLTKKRIKDDSDRKMMILVLLFCFLGGINQGFMRVTNYLIPFVITYVVKMVYSIYLEKKKNHILKLLSLSCLVLLLFHKAYYYLGDTSDLSAHTRRYELWYPYESILYPQKHTYRELIFYNAMENQQTIRNGE